MFIDAQVICVYSFCILYRNNGVVWVALLLELLEHLTIYLYLHESLSILSFFFFFCCMSHPFFSLPHNTQHTPVSYFFLHHRQHPVSGHLHLYIDKNPQNVFFLFFFVAVTIVIQQTTQNEMKTPHSLPRMYTYWLIVASRKGRGWLFSFDNTMLFGYYNNYYYYDCKGVIVYMYQRS